jgi:hypothetical protein
VFFVETSSGLFKKLDDVSGEEYLGLKMRGRAVIVASDWEAW